MRQEANDNVEIRERNCLDFHSTSCRLVYVHTKERPATGQGYGSRRLKEVVATMQIILREALAPEDPRHGTHNGYRNYLCRCQPCKDAWAAYTRERRATKRGEAA